MPAPEPIPDLLKAVNAASGKAFALWITFLSVGTYLAITIGTTTHRQLLLAGPVQLPLLGVDLPLFAFYGFAPPLFVVLHLYVLMQLYLLARLLRMFDEQLQDARMSGPEQRITRGQLDKFVFTQSLIGVPQDWIVRLFLRIVVWLSFLVGPVLLLLGFEFRFLPYHSILAIIVQQVTLSLDLVLLLLLWPKITRTNVRQLQPWREVLAFFGWGFAILCSAAIGIIGITIPLGIRTVFPMQGYLPEAILVLGNERLVEPDEDKLSRLTVTLLLRHRDLQEGVFNGTDLRKADLSDANLRRAVLVTANLSKANLSHANLREADLQGANLSGANLGNADLFDASLTAARLSGANLSGASLNGANLSGIDPRLGNLKFDGADLSDADLNLASLLGANLNNANLQNARNLTQKQLDVACGTDAKLPPGLTLKPCPAP